MKHVKSALVYSFLLVLSACSNGLVGRWAGDCMMGSSRMIVEFTGDNRVMSQQASCQGGFNQGGFGQNPFDPYNQGGFNQGGFNQGGFNQGGFNQGGFNQGGFNQGGFNQSGFGQGFGGSMGSYQILDGNRVSIMGSILNSYGNDFLYRVDGNRLTLSPSFGGGGFNQGGFNQGGFGQNPFDPYNQGGFNQGGFGQQGFGNQLTFIRMN